VIQILASQPVIADEIPWPGLQLSLAAPIRDVRMCGRDVPFEGNVVRQARCSPY
jgi:hypothetical protein